MKKEQLPPAQQARNDAYNQFVKEVTPTHNLAANMLKAFIMGGLICLLGQFILNFCTNWWGLDKEQAASWCSIVLVFLSVLLTSINVYPSFANWGGAGALVPITGFANGVCSTALEWKVEGQVFGTGSKIFTIAGPVILYGIFSSWILGVIYWIYTMF